MGDILERITIWWLNVYQYTSWQHSNVESSLSSISVFLFHDLTLNFIYSLLRMTHTHKTTTATAATTTFDQILVHESNVYGMTLFK